MQVIVTAFAVGLTIGYLVNVVTAVTGTDQLRYILLGIAGAFIAEAVIENAGFPISPPLDLQIVGRRKAPKSSDHLNGRLFLSLTTRAVGTMCVDIP